MLKIKVKNIPSNAVDRLCDRHIHCNGCVLHHTTMVNGLEVRCMRDPRIKPSERIIRLSEQEFPTNREWLESLSDEDLATFYTDGLIIKRYAPCPINIYQIVGSFETSQQSIKEWLSQPCVYLMEEEDHKQ